MNKIIIKLSDFQPVEDKPEYYWLNKRNHQIISKEVLKEAIKNMKIVTSYFYKIRNFTPNIIPVSTALSDPIWYRPPLGKEYFIDNNGVINGLRYEPLIVQHWNTKECLGLREQCPFYIKNYQCECMQEYERLIFSLVDKERTLKAFEYCCNKFNANSIALMVYEAPNNPCSERKALQEFFNCEELKCSIK